ncbi:Dabb family protein [Micromonospora aurantiaca]|uniref:Dabb family protein n=1 Tax=Micromonospora aurantiaca (nom. illeg.) TaxID=47850 RepID=UPI003456DC8F
MLRHIVLVKSDHPEVEKVLNDLPSLIGQVPGLVEVTVAQDHGSMNRGYDRLFILDFDGPDSLAGWDVHPVHTPIRDTLLALAELIVFDIEAGGDLRQSTPGATHGATEV